MNAIRSYSFFVILLVMYIKEMTASNWEMCPLSLVKNSLTATDKNLAGFKEITEDNIDKQKHLLQLVDSLIPSIERKLTTLTTNVGETEVNLDKLEKEREVTGLIMSGAVQEVDNATRYSVEFFVYPFNDKNKVTAQCCFIFLENTKEIENINCELQPVQESLNNIEPITTTS